VIGVPGPVLTTPATEAIMRVPKATAGVRLGCHDASRLVGATFGLAVIGRLQPLFASRLTALAASAVPAPHPCGPHLIGAALEVSPGQDRRQRRGGLKFTTPPQSAFSSVGAPDALVAAGSIAASKRAPPCCCPLNLWKAIEACFG